MMTPERMDQAKSLADVTAYGAALGALMNQLPNYAALLSIVWLCIQISQSKRFYQLLDVIRCIARRIRPPKG